jgi:hypothetical protein
MSTITGSCSESSAQMLYEQGIQQLSEQRAAEQKELQQQEQANNASTTTDTKSASSASESAVAKDGFVGTQIDVYV